MGSARHISRLVLSIGVGTVRENGVYFCLRGCVFGKNVGEGREDMLRGCQREMIVLQTRESPLFESAYFVVRRGGARLPCEGEMLAEASRIIGEGSAYFMHRKRRARLRDLLLGALIGGVLSGFVFLLFCIFM